MAKVVQQLTGQHRQSTAIQHWWDCSICLWLLMFQQLTRVPIAVVDIPEDKGQENPEVWSHVPLLKSKHTDQSTLQANVALDIEELSERTLSSASSLESASDSTLDLIQADEQSEVTMTKSEDTTPEPSYTLTPDSISPPTINEPIIVIEVHCTSYNHSCSVHCVIVWSPFLYLFCQSSHTAAK